jgi:hypothetical protein
VRRVIYLHMAGAPSQLELFEHKPELKRFDGQDCPASFLAGKRFAFISGVPKLLGSQYPFHQAGQSGQWISDRLPHIEKQVDDMCFIKSMRTDQFNHAPAQLLVQTGNPRLGYASFGSWVVYGLGTENQNLPGFIVLLSGGKTPDGGKQLWSSGFLPSVYQGVQCRSHGEPVLYLDNPQSVSRSLRRSMLDTIDEINQETYAAFGNPETVTRVAQYEMAFRMQMDATDAMDIRKESDSVHAQYGSKPGEASFANNCLVARGAIHPAVSLGMGLAWCRRERGIELGLQRPLPRSRSANRRSASRPRIARFARRHTCGMGWRIRAHSDERKSRRTRDEVCGPRSQSQRLHNMAGRRWRKTGNQPWRNG